MAGDDAVFRLSREERDKLEGWLGLEAVPPRLVEEFQEIVERYRYTTAADRSRPPVATSLKALRRVDRAISALLAALAEPVLHEMLEGPEADMQQQLVTWREQVRFLQDVYRDGRSAGRPENLHRRLMLESLQALLESAHVDRADQVYVMQFACDLAGTTLP